MINVIINVGPSGSGKTTWTTSFIKENFNYLRINRDDIRKTLVGNLEGYYLKSNLNEIESVINKIETKIFNQSIAESFNIIIDNTNLKINYIKRWLDFIEQWFNPDEFIITFNLFEPDLKLNKIRVMGRDDLEKIEDCDYINIQCEQYKTIKNFIKNNIEFIYPFKNKFIIKQYHTF